MAAEPPLPTVPVLRSVEVQGVSSPRASALALALSNRWPSNGTHLKDTEHRRQRLQRKRLTRATDSADWPIHWREREIEREVNFESYSGTKR